MSRYQVHKLSVGASLALVDGSTLEGHLWLAAFSPRRSGPQTVADLAAEATRVLPFRRDDGRFVLVGKASVAAVGVERDTSDVEPLVSRIAARVTLLGGHRFRGHLLAEAGGCGSDRASDVLNATDEWFRFEGPRLLHWISKDHLLTFEPDAD